jgi:hypothetical protein
MSSSLAPASAASRKQDYNASSQNDPPVGNLNACYRCFPAKPFYHFPPIRPLQLAREAAEFRAQGGQKSQEIRARADRDVTVLLAERGRRAVARFACADKPLGCSVPEGRHGTPQEPVRLNDIYWR